MLSGHTCIDWAHLLFASMLLPWNALHIWSRAVVFQFYFLFNYTCAWVCVRVCVYLFRFPQRPEEGIGFHRTGVTCGLRHLGTWILLDPCPKRAVLQLQKSWNVNPHFLLDSLTWPAGPEIPSHSLIECSHFINGTWRNTKMWSGGPGFFQRS